jgi:malonyl CoA-acyl carrier protein transacylase
VAERLSALVVCPGRGTYGKNELGYLQRHHSARRGEIERFDALRAERGQPALSELDGAGRFSVALHTRGDVASPLIYAASYLDFLAIDRDRFDIAAVTGNSMGWYTALACGGAVTGEDGFRIVDAMGENSQAGDPGGQVLVQTADENWQEIRGLREELLALCERIGGREGARLHLSIDLGGMLVFAGNDAGLEALIAEAPVNPAREPMRLVNHGPFHTPLMKESSNRAFQLPAAWIGSPRRPMIDGRGHIWRPHASNPAELRAYTFGTQILETYDFTRALQVAVKEHAPDRIILLGPGDTLGGAIAQALIAIGWLDLKSKQDFQDLQSSNPFLLAMGREDQRGAVA